jgi:hypothetical protein
MVAEWGKQLFPLSSFIPSQKKSSDHLSRSLRSGSGSVNLAVHVSAPRELWHPLRTGIEEARQIFLIRRAGHAVKQSQQPVCATWGPPGVWSCQCQAIPAAGGVRTR